MTKKAKKKLTFEPIEKPITDLEKREKELEEREKELEEKAFDLAFKVRKAEKIKAAIKKAVSASPSKKAVFGLNRLGLPISKKSDKIRPIDSYDDNYYGENLTSGSKKIVNFFASNKGKRFEAKYVNDFLFKGTKTPNRFFNGKSYFIGKKSIKATVDDKTGIEYFTGIFASDFK